MNLFLHFRRTSDLIRQYFILISIVLVLILAGQILLDRQLSIQKNDYHVINISGRQRMLSQKISKVALEITETHDEETLKELTIELENALVLFEQSQNELRFSDNLTYTVPGSREKIDRMYRELDPVYKQILNSGNKLVVLLKNNQTKPADIINTRLKILSSENSFLVGMNNIVFEIDDISAKKLTRSRIVLFSVNSFLYITIVLLWLLLIYPAMCKAQETEIKKIEKMTE